MRKANDSNPKTNGKGRDAINPDVGNSTAKGQTMKAKAEVKEAPKAKKVSPAKVKAVVAPKCISEVLLIPLERIEVRAQVRTEFDEESIAQLAADIAERGLRQPIEVNPIGDERYLLTMGERRFRAFQVLQQSAIPALVVKVDETSRLFDQLAENIQREGLSLNDEVQAVKQMHEALGSSKAVADRIKKSPAWVCKRLALANPDLGWNAQEAMNNGITEDPEILGVLSQLENVSYGHAANALASLKAGTASRESLRDALRDAKKPTPKPIDPKIERQRAERERENREANARNHERMLARTEGTGDEFIDYIISHLENTILYQDENPDQELDKLREDQRDHLVMHFQAVQRAAATWTSADWAARLSFEVDEHSTYLEQLAAVLAIKGTAIVDCYSFIDLAWNAHGGGVAK